MKKHFVGFIGVGQWDPEFSTSARYWFADKDLAKQAVDFLNKNVRTYLRWETTFPDHYLPGVQYVNLHESLEDYRNNHTTPLDTKLEENFDPTTLKEVVIPEYYSVSLSADNGSYCGGNFVSRADAEAIANSSTGYWYDKGTVEVVKEQKFNVISTWEEFLDLAQPKKKDLGQEF